jgi:peptidyl-prolyl cis-trans isomerase A (cyclophilin A)
MFESSKHLWSCLLLLTSLTTLLHYGHGIEMRPPTAKISCETTKGPLKIDVHSDWAPLGAERFVTLVKDGFYTDIAFFRCVRGFLTQFGISGDEKMKHWHRETLLDDPNLNLGIQKNYISFAGGGPNTRSTQIFIAFEYLDFLGKEPWETPFAVVTEGQATLDALYKEYGDIPPFGKGPDQQKIQNRGNAYVHENFPLIDYLQSCTVIEEEPSMVFTHPDDETDAVDPGAVAIEEEEEPTHDDVNKVKIVPRGPDELDKLEAFEKKNRFRKGGNSLKEQLKKSQNNKLSLKAVENKEEDQKRQSAMYAVFIMCVLIGALYYVHRQQAVSAAVGKKS